MVDTYARLIALAEKLEAVAEREEKALHELQERGIALGEYCLNYPQEQRAHAIEIRNIAQLLDPPV